MHPDHPGHLLCLVVSLWATVGGGIVCFGAVWRAVATRLRRKSPSERLTV